MQRELKIIMEEKLLRDYARLIACQGGHVVKGDIVWINAGLDQPEFVTMVVEECYKAGAKDVTSPRSSFGSSRLKADPSLLNFL